MSTTVIIDPSWLPESLWNPSAKVVKTPAALSDSYARLLDERGLTALHGERDRKVSPVGGLSQKETDQHLAQSFLTSVARAQLALLDPKAQLGSVSESALRKLLGNSLSLTDAPCGAAAASLAFLCTVAELRATSVLPRLPLSVSLLAADLSEPARTYAQILVNEVKENLEKQAIFVSCETIEWDALDTMSCTELIRRMTVAGEASSQMLLLISNFTAFLVGQSKQARAEKRIGEIFRFSSYKDMERSIAIWMEPAMNRAVSTGGIFSWLKRRIHDIWSTFAREREGQDVVRTTRSGYHPRLDDRFVAEVRLAVMLVDLVSSE